MKEKNINAPRKEEKETKRVEVTETDFMLDFEDALEAADNPFYYDLHKVPKGMQYEWKRLTVLGKEDRPYMAGLQRLRWRAVPASRHPETAGASATDDETIVIGGQVLMEREKRLCDISAGKAHSQAIDNARGQFERLKIPGSEAMPRFVQKHNRNYEAAPIPE